MRSLPNSCLVARITIKSRVVNRLLLQPSVSGVEVSLRVTGPALDILSTFCDGFIVYRVELMPGLWSRSRRLGLETVSRRTNVSSQSRLEKNCQTYRSRLGLGHLRIVPKTIFRPHYAGHSTQCERALDVVVTIAHHINTLKQ